MLHARPDLPTGQPGQRLRHLAGHYHAFGPRAFLDLLERVIDGRLPDAMAIVEFLERAARSDPAMMKPLGAYELEAPIFDMTWVIDMDRRLGRVPRPRGRPRRPPSSSAALRLVPPSLEPPEDQAMRD
jgi:hypothetical protein